MEQGSSLILDENTVFQNMKKEQMTFHEVFREIVEFIKGDLNSSYRISIGTDSQVNRQSTFVTCIHVHRIGKGAVGFLHKSQIERPIKNLREKIYLETCASLQIAYLFSDERINMIYEVMESKGVTFEFHIDIGRKGETKKLIKEMVGMVSGINFVPKIKPDSYCASCFADRYTKAI